MKVIKRFFSSSPYLPPKEAVEDYLEEIRFETPNVLPSDYQTTMNVFLLKCEHESEFLLELLKKLQQLTDESAIIKMLTVIHFFVIDKNYKKECIKDLEEIEISLFSLKTEETWFTEFLRTYLTYFIKISSQSDVYLNIINKEYEVPPTLHLTHLFRLANTVMVLFPSILNAVNIVGRYQAEKHTAIKELFVILSGELVKIYSYIRFLCDQILRQYRIYNPKDLKCFLEYLPELSLLCDKIEDILVNKYLKGKKIAAKIEFKEEKVSEVLYYLEYEYNEGKENTNETSLP